MAGKGRISLHELIHKTVRHNLSRQASVAPLPSGGLGTGKSQSPAFDQPDQTGSHWLAVQPANSERLAWKKPAGPESGAGMHDSVEEAVASAGKAFLIFRELSLEQRREIVANIRRHLLARVEDLAQMAVQETGLGRIEHKIAKNHLVITKTPEDAISFKVKLLEKLA